MSNMFDSDVVAGSCQARLAGAYSLRSECVTESMVTVALGTISADVVVSAAFLLLIPSV